MRRVVTRKRVKKLLSSCLTFKEIAAGIGCSRMAVSTFFAQEANADLLELFNQKMEEVIDTAEEKLKGRIDRDDFESIRFLLRTRGQSRGYREMPSMLIPGGALKIVMESIGYNPSEFIDIKPEPLKQITRHAKKEENTEDNVSPASDNPE